MHGIGFHLPWVLEERNLEGKIDRFKWLVGYFEDLPVPCNSPVSYCQPALCSSLKGCSLLGGRMGCTLVTTNDTGGVGFLPAFYGCLSLLSVECKEGWPSSNCNRRDLLLRRVCFYREVLLPSFRREAVNPHCSTAKSFVVSSPLHSTSEFGDCGMSRTEENVPKFNTSLRWAVFFWGLSLVGELKADVRLGAHQFNPANTSAGSHCCSLEIGIFTLSHFSSGQGGTGRVEIHLHAWGPWDEQTRERHV